MVWFRACDKSVRPCNHHPSQDVGYFSHSTKSPRAPSCSAIHPPPRALGTAALLSVAVALPFPERHMDGLLPCAGVCRLLSPGSMPLQVIRVAACVSASFAVSAD